MILAALLAGLATPAFAAETAFPRIEGKVQFEIENDWNYRSDDPGSERNELFPTIEPEITVTMLPGLSLFALAVLEPVRDPAPGEDAYFEDIGAFVEELHVTYETGRFALRGGKFTPAFGIAWDAAPGIHDVGDDYEFSERLGVAASVELGGKKSGSHKLSASTFFLDTTFLAESTLTGRGTLDRSDGGVSNTGDFKSFAVSLDGQDVGGAKGLRYHVAYIRQAAGIDGTGDEKGFALALTHRLPITDAVSVTPLVEYVSFENADGVLGQDRDYLTLAARVDWNRWNLSLAYSGRDTDSATASTEDYQFQVSAGYAFDFGFEVDAGWLIVNESNVETRTLGILLAYALEF